jgi:hypothetical protein
MMAFMTALADFYSLPDAVCFICEWQHDSHGQHQDH